MQDDSGLGKTTSFGTVGQVRPAQLIKENGPFKIEGAFS